MDESSRAPHSTTQDFVGILRNAAESLSIKALAIETGIDASRLGKVLYQNGTLTLRDHGRLLVAIGKKVVSADAMCVKRKRLEAATTLMLAALHDEDSLERLLWEDAE